MTQEQFNLVCTQALQVFRLNVPKDTGNMRFNATQLNGKGRGVFEIVVNPKIAPYSVYTNEKWISPKWGGRQNPNEGWVERGVDAVVNFLARRLGGKVVKA